MQLGSISPGRRTTIPFSLFFADFTTIAFCGSTSAAALKLLPANTAAVTRLSAESFYSNLPPNDAFPMYLLPHMHCNPDDFCHMRRLSSKIFFPDVCSKSRIGEASYSGNGMGQLVLGKLNWGKRQGPCFFSYCGFTQNDLIEPYNSMSCFESVWTKYTRTE